MLNTDKYDLQVLLPVHNEAESIRAVIKEIYDVFSQQVRFGFIVCEDGSKDNTEEVLEELSKQYPMQLIMSKARKGYSRAVTDGMRVLQAPYILCLDSDGQCDPLDFKNFWEKRNHADVLIGWRTNRADNTMRKSFSRLFYVIYQLVFRLPIHDPSCPFILAPKQAIDLIVNDMGAMQQGFWWEFIARVHRAGYSIMELPVNHRARIAGTTQVYKVKKLPGIFFHHIVAIFTIWKTTRRK